MMKILSHCCYGHLQWDLSNISYIIIGDNSITPSPPACNPSAIFYEHLTMEAHVNNVCRSFFFHLHNIRSIRRVLDMKTTVIIVQALVISRLDYCNSLLYGLPAIVIKRLERVQNAAARVIAKAGRREHISHQFTSNFTGYRSISAYKVQDPAIDISCSTWPRPDLHHRTASALYIT